VRQLPPAHPTRLGLVQNLSLFYFENMNQPQQAIKLTERQVSALCLAPSSVLCS
jgi:hypothetical protein